MSRKPFAISVVSVLAVIAGYIVLLNTGGVARAPRALGDAAGDAKFEGGENVAQADVRFAGVYRAGGWIELRVRMASEPPQSLEGETLEWRWTLSSGGDEWIVSVTVEESMRATLLPPRSGPGFSTLDGSFPGEVDVDGDSIVVSIRPDLLQGWPARLSWSLTTTHRTTVGETPPAHDQVPDAGAGRFGGGR
jgi:hypothetical protein